VQQSVVLPLDDVLDVIQLSHAAHRPVLTFYVRRPSLASRLGSTWLERPVGA
jgi:hypothetical protein